MNVFVYQAALLCEECGLAERERLSPWGLTPPAADSEDSDLWPQGLYPNGGGEADTPNHCDHCGLFLENPLTSDGEAYVADLLIEHFANGRGNKEILLEWAEFYDIALTDLFDRKNAPTIGLPA